MESSPDSEFRRDIMSFTHKKHFTVTGGKTGAALKEAAKRESLAKSDKDKAALQAERAAFYQQKNAERKEARQKADSREAERQANRRLNAFLDGEVINLSTPIKGHGMQTYGVDPKQLAEKREVMGFRKKSKKLSQKRCTFEEPSLDAKLAMAFGGRH